MLTNFRDSQDQQAMTNVRNSQDQVTTNVRDSQDQQVTTNVKRSWFYLCWFYFSYYINTNNRDGVWVIEPKTTKNCTESECRVG